MVLELNASDERGIDVVREQIKTFAATKTFNKTAVGSNDLKLVILDEADAMTSAAQNALRRVMEKYVKNVRFIIICNYVGQIIPPLQSRCTRFRFAPLPLDCLQERMDFVIKQEGLTVSSQAKTALVRIANGDMRRVLNVLQAAAAAFHPKEIDEDAIYAVTAAPHPTDLQRILDWLTNDHYDISQSFTSTKYFVLYFILSSRTFLTIYVDIQKLQKERSLALSDIIREIFDLSSVRLNLSVPSRIYLTKKLADIE
jgi:replication factor C subunit 3/5